MKVYIDSEFRCHVSDDGTLREVEDSIFDGKCPAFIEGYRFVPEGETWVRDDGQKFTGVMIAPWKPYEQLRTAQLEYELALAKAQLASMSAAIETGGVRADA